MLKIGDFSKLSRVSIRMLRHYDDIGLLKPAETDDFTGYRYYREDQLFLIGRITALKDMGFALADIVRILEIYDDRKQLDQFLAARQKELTDQAKETEYKLMLLDTARKRLRKEQKMSFDVTVKTIPERYAATVHTIIPKYEDEGLAWSMMGACRDQLVPADPCYAIAEFLDPEYKEENVEIVVSMAVKGKYQDTEHVKSLKARLDAYRASEVPQNPNPVSAEKQTGGKNNTHYAGRLDHAMRHDEEAGRIPPGYTIDL